MPPCVRSPTCPAFPPAGPTNDENESKLCPYRTGSRSSQLRPGPAAPPANARPLNSVRHTPPSTTRTKPCAPRHLRPVAHQSLPASEHPQSTHPARPLAAAHRAAAESHPSSRASRPDPVERIAQSPHRTSHRHPKAARLIHPAAAQTAHSPPESTHTRAPPAPAPQQSADAAAPPGTHRETSARRETAPLSCTLRPPARAIPEPAHACPPAPDMPRTPAHYAPRQQQSHPTAARQARAREQATRYVQEHQQ